MRGSHKFLQYCTKFSQILSGTITIVLILTSSSTAAQEYQLKMSDLNPDAVIRSRGPATYVPNDEAVSSPIKLETWYDGALAEDSAGVMIGVRENLSKWESEEEYVKNWNLESLNLYEKRTTDYKEGYIRSKILKYLDKRISGEIKQAEKGSTLHRVGKVQKALKPAGKVAVSNNIKLKFKVRILEGKGKITVDNPWVDYTTDLNAKGEVKMRAKKDFKEIGVKTVMKYELNGPVTVNVDKTLKQIKADASLKYDATNESYVASIDKRLLENLNAKLSSDQKHDTPVFTKDSNTTLQFYYNTPF